MYSGDPVANSGWICNFKTDQRLMANTGTFQLEKDKPQEIIIAYVVGRGNTSLESINTAKDITKDAIAFYNSNFTEIPVSVKEN
ncbi:MAG: hypothetical protein H6609_01665 [Ignavibacteriales bacterium]|nr:hypothetical protein [Ignavibacteriales bacterium]